jgi:hypothetical protein
LHPIDKTQLKPIGFVSVLLFPESEIPTGLGRRSELQIWNSSFSCRLHLPIGVPQNLNGTMIYWHLFCFLKHSGFCFPCAFAISPLPLLPPARGSYRSSSRVHRRLLPSPRILGSSCSLSYLFPNCKQKVESDADFRSASSRLRKRWNRLAVLVGDLHQHYDPAPPHASAPLPQIRM